MADCGREHDLVIPAEIQARCTYITTQLNNFIFGNEMVRAVRTLMNDCQQRQLGLWNSVLDSLPVPTQWIVQVIAEAKPIPKELNARVGKICAYFNINRSTFDDFFLGGSSYPFLETLSELTKHTPPLHWGPTRDALDRARKRRMREIDTKAKGKLWLPTDIGHAALDLGSETFRTMNRLGKAWQDWAANQAKEPGTKRQRPGVSPRRRHKKTPAPASHGRASPAPSIEGGRRTPPYRSVYEASPLASSAGGTPAAKRFRWSGSPLDDGLFPEFGASESVPRETAPPPPPFQLDAASPNPVPGPSLLPVSPVPVSPLAVSLLAVSPVAVSPVPVLPVPISPVPVLPLPVPLASDSPAAPANPSDPEPLDVMWQPGLLSDNDRQRLLNPEGWLSGIVMNMALEMVCSGTTSCFAVVSDVLVPTSRPENHPAYAAKIRGQKWQAFVLPLHMGGNHWALAHLDCAGKVACVYDSMPSDEHEDEAQRIVQRFIAEFLGHDALQWQITAALSPRQADWSSCGIFTIATAIHILFGRGVPSAPYRSAMWRVLVARLVGLEAPPGRATASVWPYSLAEDRQVAALPSSLPAVAEFRAGLEAGCTIADGQAFVAAVAKATAAAAKETRPKIKRAIRERQQTLGELRAAGALVDAARAVTGAGGVELEEENGGDRRRAPAVRFVAGGGFGACVEASIVEGMASVKWLSEQLEIAEGAGRG
ncbi:hypothetical protein QBC39DRAFT_399458 [Podospora conica]|nr:hypothetical protein QBC39DRAFT_399458 [Schizothecium conicum]